MSDAIARTEEPLYSQNRFLIRQLDVIFFAIGFIHSESMQLWH